MSFIMLWERRIDFIYNLGCESQGKCGMEIMNLVFIEWTIQCTADYEYK